VLCLVIISLLKTNFRNDIDKIHTNLKKLWLIPLFVILDLVVQVVIQNVLPINSTNQSGIENGIQSSSSMGNFFIMIIVVFIGPIMEEVIFQYFIQKVILKNNFAKFINNKKMISILSVIIVTVLFMAFHIQSFKDIYDLSFLEYLDLSMFAIIYELTDENLLYPIFTHICLNLIAFISVIVA